MASPNPPTNPVGPDTLITVKVVIDGNNRKFKLALRDLGANVLPVKLRFLLAIPAEAEVKFDRFSDSAGAYITLDSSDPAVYKQLYRAAKAKLKLRLRANVIQGPPGATSANITAEKPPQENETDDHNPTFQSKTETRPSYLDTVLSHPHLPSSSAPCFQSFQTSRPLVTTSAIPAALAPSNDTMETVASAAQALRASILSKATLPTISDFHSTFTIDCNQCGKFIPDEHYHCGICEQGDFDLCPTCIDQGKTCDGEDHWLIKRYIRDGVVHNNITERLAPKNPKPEEVENASPTNTRNTPKFTAARTCNSCIRELPEMEFVSCRDCPDFDLCHICFQIGEHGHHPAHTFGPVDESYYVPEDLQALCKPGRGLVHDAVCDGCDKRIFGVRHKCLTCPDWDYCSTCVASAAQIHPGHRFAPLYQAIASPTVRPECHFGIYCDGPMCTNKHRRSYITGDRYKCAVCHDTDFCANCEALPTNTHNKTHPLIKFKTYVRRVSVTTLGENGNGEMLSQMGDHPRAKNAATETVPRTLSTNAATQVQTVAEVKPTDLPVPDSPKTEIPEKSRTATSDFQAWFESDSTPDGTRFGPNRLVSQSWTLRNPGPHAWPAGCAVYYIGGDDMRNLDAKHPSSVSAMTAANRSNVLEQGLEPGKTAVFEVLLKSPPREGRVISYWRLKTPEGLPFGHKLWVDITVASTPVEPSELRATTPPAVPVAESVSQVEEAEIKTEEISATCTMMFPKLEKESPESSVHEVAEGSAITVEPVKAEDQELLEDIESLELDDEETDDGFMTDEEYDILDASDEDFLIEAHNAVTKK